MWMCAGNSEPYWPPSIHPQNQNKKDHMHKTCMQKGYKLVSSILIPIDNSGFIQFYSCVTAGFNWSMLKVDSDSSDANWGSVPECRRAMAHPASTRGWETEWINCPPLQRARIKDETVEAYLARTNWRQEGAA